MLCCCAGLASTKAVVKGIFSKLHIINCIEDILPFMAV